MDSGTISGNPTLLKRFTRLINERLKKVNSLIWKATGTWEYDDSNQTDLPIATTDLVDGQQDYSLPSYVQKIMRVEVLDSDGNARALTQIDQSEISQALTEYHEDAGLPTAYDLIGGSIFLYPKPSSSYVTLTNGLKIYFSRDVVEFNSTATNTEPGFVENFHRMLSIGASLDYCTGFLSDDQTRIITLQNMWNDYKEELLQFYGSRNQAKKLKISPTGEGILNQF